jgi:hypothetical protein
MGETFEVLTASYDGTVRRWRCGEDGEWEGRAVWGETSSGSPEGGDCVALSSSSIGDARGRISDLEICEGRGFVARFGTVIEIVDFFGGRGGIVGG